MKSQAAQHSAAVRNADLDFWKTRQLVAVFTEMSCLGLLGFIDDIHLMLTEVIMFDDFVSYTYHYIPYTELIRTLYIFGS